MKDKLVKGQAFIGIDNIKYYFLGFDYDGQILFTSLDLWTDKEQKYFEKNNLFIKEILTEKSELIENCKWYYQNDKELNNASMENKIKRCLDIISESNTLELEIKPIKIGSLVRGQAYSKEFNQYYELIGFIVENEVYFNDQLKAKQKGFFAIYHSNCNESVPLIFERRHNKISSKYLAGNNDVFDVQEILVSSNEVNNYINDELKCRLNNDLNEFIKDK